VRKNLGYWKAMGCSTNVLSWLARGIPLRTQKAPPPYQFPNKPMDDQERAFIREEVKTHLADGSFRVIERAEARVINPIKVVRTATNGKMRMCIDSRWTNAYLAAPQFNLETLGEDLGEIIQRNDLLVTSDISKACYSIPLEESAGAYLCFEFEGRLIAPTVMTFGESQAPFYWNKIMREVVTFARALGFRMMNYFDDNLWTIGKEEKSEEKETLRLAQWIMPRLGFTYNAKCDWTPKTAVKFLGLNISSEKFEFTVPAPKMERIRQFMIGAAERVKADRPIATSELASALGLMNSTRLALRPVATWTRALYADMERARETRNKFTELRQRAKEELEFWHQNLELVNGAPIRDPAHSATLRVDAGEHGFGGHTETSTHSGLLPAALIGTSSTRRELFGLVHTADALRGDLRGRHVLVQMDSFPAICNLTKGGGPKQDLADLIKQWDQWCRQNQVTCSYEWIRREENEKADRLSKAVDLQLALRPAVVSLIERKCGPTAPFEKEHVIRRSLKRVLATPNFNQIANTLHIILQYKIKAVIVYPVWPAQPWWPTMSKAGEHFDLPPVSQAMVKAAVDEQLRKSGWQLRATIVN
jgi:hypothetical protein